METIASVPSRFGCKGVSAGEWFPNMGGRSVDVVGLAPDPHGIHLHATGSCSPDFKAAAGHINPGQGKHDLRNPEGLDNGDLPHVFAAADGSADAEFFSIGSPWRAAACGRSSTKTGRR